MGILPAIKITDPYSPKALAKEVVIPVNRAGKIIGNVILKKVVSC